MNNIINNKLSLPKNRHFSFDECVRQICRDPNDTRAQMLDGKVVITIEIGDNQCLATLEDQQDHIQISVVHKSEEAIDESLISAYVTNLLDLNADLEPFYNILEKGPRNSKFAPVFECSKGLRIIGIPDLFQALAWAIIGQQISLAAAFSIKNRFCTTFGKKIVYKDTVYYSHPTANEVLQIDTEQLRSIGFSRPKAKYLLNIAKTLVDNPDIQKQLEQKSSAEIAKYLLSFVGIGNWSCEYILLKCFRQYDIYPVTDAALITAIKNLYQMEQKPTSDEIHKIFDDWKGWGGYLCFYIWYWTSTLKLKSTS